MRIAKPIMIQGTASSVGKSLICAGLCRIFKQDGYRVAPFKSQNMALNSFITRDGGEMGRAQVVQAEAAGIEPEVSMNPILLKPTTDRQAQVIINGKVFENLSAMEYDTYKCHLKDTVTRAYEDLAGRHDIIVIEGAGSPAEINLRDRDIVNMGMAEIAEAPVILVGDIDKGGVFASLAGTMLLLTEAEKARVKGVIINKFRGDIEILKPGLAMLEDIIHIPVLGVIPYTRLNIEDEDGHLDERFLRKAGETSSDIDIAVIRLPHMSNYTDFYSLENIPGVVVRYVENAQEIGNPDMLILPGTKNTIGDLMYLRRSGIEHEILKLHGKDTLIFGVCGGYQMLGKEICDPHGIESNIPKTHGLGLLDMKTLFGKEKVTTQVEAVVGEDMALPCGLRGVKVKGYEIHMGVTEFSPDCIPYLTITSVLGRNENRLDGVRNREGNVFGTYIHGVFDHHDFAVGLINYLRTKKGLDPVKDWKSDYRSFKEKQYDLLADTLRSNLDMEAIYRILNEGHK